MARWHERCSTAAPEHAMNTLRTYAVVATIALGWLGFTAAGITALLAPEPELHLIAPEVVVYGDPSALSSAASRTASTPGEPSDCCPN